MKERLPSQTQFDAHSPNSLKETQLWFASIITQPINEDNCIPAMAPSGRPIEKEAWDYIKPSPTLRPAQRIELYSQQYWWRLLSCLHEEFPLVTRLFGYRDFDQTLGIPYLTKYPPNHWSLGVLGEWFPSWIKDEYHAPDKKLVLDAATLDLAYHTNFFAPTLKPLDLQDLPNPQDFSYLLTCPLQLQPWLFIFDFNYDLFTYRMKFLKESPEYWMKHDFPPLNRSTTSYVLFRNLHGNPAWDTLSLAEASLLNYFRNGATLEEACQWLEEQEAIFKQAEKKLHVWIQGWIIKKWLFLKNSF